jgi:hypothetical protein
MYVLYSNCREINKINKRDFWNTGAYKYMYVLCSNCREINKITKGISGT